MAHFAELGENNVVLRVIVVYNANFRKNYAGIGYTYDSGRDAFVPPKPFASWTLDEDTARWQAPVAYPTDGKIYTWDEDTVNWIEAQQ